MAGGAYGRTRKAGDITIARTREARPSTKTPKPARTVYGPASAFHRIEEGGRVRGDPTRRRLPFKQ